MSYDEMNMGDVAAISVQFLFQAQLIPQISVLAFLRHSMNEKNRSIPDKRSGKFVRELIRKSFTVIFCDISHELHYLLYKCISLSKKNGMTIRKMSRLNTTF